MRTDYRLFAAVLAPLLLVWWVPPWSAVIFREGLTGALVFSISVAVLEEVVFRGGIQGWLRQKAVFHLKLFGFSRANWVTSLLFACAHAWQHPLGLVPGYLAVSLVLGHFRDHYNGIRVPLALHLYYNLALLFLSLLAR